MIQTVSCIAVDWGTTNRRAWALGPDGVIAGQRADGAGLLQVRDRAFAESLAGFLGDWVESARGAPVLIAGMAGSRLGWVEAPYMTTPAPLADLAKHLTKAGRIGASDCWIAPGVSFMGPVQPDVMRGEECQILGSLLTRGIEDGIFVLPGTHSKWARVAGRGLTEFRTYMTGELFDQLRKSGTLAQLMTGEAHDPNAFARGIEASGSDVSLLNRLFGVRTLGLLGGMKGQALASYLSGLLIGSEMRDALRAWPQIARDGATAIGSRAMLSRYATCAAQLGLTLRAVDNDDVLPPALFWLAKQAGLISA